MKKDKYFAFISYKREDEKWAKWLQRKLESYCFPSNLNGRTDLPRHIRPICRDVTDLTPGILAEEINRALNNSQWLIVVCSPRSAKSIWVCKEAQAFIDLGRADHIIPFVIEGNPFSNDSSSECFPDSILNLTNSRELLAANINDMGRNAAVVKVVARMFGIQFNTLWQRYEKEHRRKMLMIICCAILLTFVSFLIAWTFYNNNIALDKANEIIRKEKDRAELTSDSLKNALDSIYAKENIINIKNIELKKSNQLLAKERDNVLQSNQKMKENQSRFLAERASALVDQGDSYLGRLFALEALPPNLPYTIEAEDALRKACLNDNTVLRGHKDVVLSASFSSDGKYIVSASRDMNIRIWDAKTGKCLQILSGHKGRVTAAIFSHDGKYIASSSWDKTVRIWDFECGRCIHVLQDSALFTNYVSFSPDDKYIASTSINIWEVKSGKLVHKIDGHKDEVNTISFSSDGKYVVSSSDDSTARVWEAYTGKLKRTYKGHTGKVNSAFFSPDGKMIVTAGDVGDNSINVWDVETGRVINNYRDEQTGNVFFASFSPDGKKIVSGYYDRKVRIWDVKTGRKDCFFEEHTGSVLSVMFSQDGKKIVSASNDQTIRLREAEPNRAFAKIVPPEDGYWYPTLSPSGKMIAYSSNKDECIFVYDIHLNKIINRWKSKYDNFYTKKFNPQDKFIADVAKDSTINIWDIATGNITMTIKGLDFSYSSDGKYIVSSVNNNTIIIWNAQTGRIINKIHEKERISKFAVSPDDKYLATGSIDSKIRFWDIKTGKCIKIFSGHEGTIKAISFNSKGSRMVSTSTEDEIFVWEIQSGNIITKKRGREEGSFYTSFCQYSNDLIASCSLDKIIRIWDSKTGKETFSLKCNTYCLWAQISPDGKYVVYELDDNSINYQRYLPIQELVNETLKRFKNRHFTPAERRKYYLD